MAVRPTVVIELAADAQHARALAAGGVFAPGCALELNEECALIVRSAGGSLRLQARVVFLDPGRGAGLELAGFGPEMKEQLAALVGSPPRSGGERGASAGAAAPSGGEHDNWAAEWDDDPDGVPAAPTAELRAVGGPSGGVDAALALGSGELDLPADHADGGRAHSAGAGGDGGDARDAAADRGDPRDAAADRGDARDTAADRGDPRDTAADRGDPRDTADDSGVLQSLRDRLRHLPIAQQIRKALSADLQERIFLERTYGKNVWEALLRNPRLTAPEVARIARMATLPRPLIEVILSNGAWLQLPDVRRALLSSSRLQIDQALRVLRLLSKPELKLAAVQSAYPHPVRDAAKRMLREP